MLTQQRLKEVLSYDPATGFFRRLAHTKGVNRVGKIAGTSTHNGYVQIWIDNRAYLGHRLAWLYVYGVWPVRVDHKDQNKKYNAITNLRESTQSQNAVNVTLRKTNTSGFRGVSWHKKARKYAARIKYNYKQIHIGLFVTPEEAHVAYLARAKELFGEFAA